MMKLGNCPHCGAPINLDMRLFGNKMGICSYCDCAIRLEPEIHEAIRKDHLIKKNEQAERERAAAEAEALKQYRLKEAERQNQLYQAQQMEAARIRKKYETNKSIRLAFAIITTFWMLGMLGVPSLLCKQYKWFGITWGLTVFCALVCPTDAAAGFALLVNGIIIPIISIKNIK